MAETKEPPKGAAVVKEPEPPRPKTEAESKASIQPSEKSDKDLSPEEKNQRRLDEEQKKQLDREREIVDEFVEKFDKEFPAANYMDKERLLNHLVIRFRQNLPRAEGAAMNRMELLASLRKGKNFSEKDEEKLEDEWSKPVENKDAKYVTVK